MGLRNKNIKLRTFFIQYLLALFAGFLATVLIGLGLFFILLKTGFLISVGDIEADIESKITVIASAKAVSAELIPETCEYAVVSTRGEFLSGSLTKPETDAAWNMIKDGRRISGISLVTGLNAQCYYPVERKDEVCIIVYPALSQFPAGFFRKHLPAPEIILFWTVLAAIFAEIILLSRLYGRKISRKLIPLKSATEKIQNKDLEFDVQYTGIQEIDAALRSLEDMKTELKRSLESQWRIEQMQKMQISALAHDIKTPLTVVRGNAEMLSDTDQTEEQRGFTHYISKNADQMEQYVQTLIDLSRAEAGHLLRRESVNTRVFLDELHDQIHALVSIKHLNIEFEERELPEYIDLDSSLIQRAIMNIVSNAVDYSPAGGLIRFTVSAEKHKIRFVIVDSGEGFSAEDLKNAAMQFYQGDSSRSSKSHYGMGLFIADSIARQHGGSLSIANSPSKGGGMVTIEIQGVR